MDVTAFTGLKTGHLLPIKTRRADDWAFMPENLPPRWQMDDSLWRLVADARGKICTLDGIGRTLPNPLLLLRPLQRQEALRSSSLEGTYATAEQLLLFEILEQQRPREPVDESERSNEWREVFNYDIALRKGTAKLRANHPLDLGLMQELHRILLTDVRGREKNPGQFRTKQVFVGGNRRYIPPPAPKLNGLLDNLVAYLCDMETDMDPIVKTYVAHYQFEAIHPFSDGNGRVGRLLLSLSLGKWLGHTRPWLYMSEFFERHREEYFRRLFRISCAGEWDEWVRFCLEGTIVQAENAIRRCEELQTLREAYKKKYGHASSRMHGIIDKLFKTPVVRVADIQRIFSVTYPTARSDLAKLESAGVLKEVDDKYPKLFVAPKILDAAYGDPED